MGTREAAPGREVRYFIVVRAVWRWYRVLVITRISWELEWLGNGNLGSSSGTRGTVLHCCLRGLELVPSSSYQRWYLSRCPQFLPGLLLSSAVLKGNTGLVGGPSQRKVPCLK